MTPKQLKILNAIIQEITVTVSIQPEATFYGMFKITRTEALKCANYIKGVIDNDGFNSASEIIGWRGNMFSWMDLRNLFLELKKNKLIPQDAGEKIN